MGEQRIEGSRNVQIQGVVGSPIQITYNEATRTVPLESALVPVARKLHSPARLIRAHAGVIPYVDRGGLMEGLESWIDAPAPFSGQVIGGRGGAGKTRLAVELCQRLETSHWLCGFLIRIADQGMLDSLVEVPTPRLVVIDYAETRPEQLELLLPLLSARAIPECPVRVLLLVRGGAEGKSGWAERLANRVDALDAVLDECEVRQLEDTRFEVEERRRLFETAVPALAERLNPEADPVGPPDLTQETFASPLMVVIAACLAALGESAPATREALLDEVLAHERRYWREEAGDLDADDIILERMVALATLLGADTEEQAEKRLALLRFLRGAPAERRNRLARWVHSQYPAGPRWWNPLEPDLVGEHLVVRCFADQPDVLRGALAGENAEQIIRPLEVLGRAAADHPELVESLTPILGEELERLCVIAIAQAEAMRGDDLLYGKAVTVAAAIAALLQAVEVDAGVLSVVGDLMPPRADLVLNELAVTLATLYVERLRPLAEENPSRYVSALSIGLNNLSNRLAEAGRHPEALVAIEEAVQLRRPLAEANPSASMPELAGALSNLTGELAAVGRHPEALAAAEEAVAIYRPLAKASPSTYASDLAGALNNLSNRLGKAGRHPEALAAIEEAVSICRPMAEADPSHAPDLARLLSNLTGELAAVGRHPEALAAIEESVRLHRRLAEAHPSAYVPDLAQALNNFSNRLAEAERHPEALAATEEAVRLCRLMAEANPSAYGPELANALNNLSNRLAEVDRYLEAFVAIEEAVEIYRPLAEANPSLHAPDLARALSNLSHRLVVAGRTSEALVAMEEAVAIYRPWAEADPAVYSLDLEGSLNSLIEFMDKAD